MRKQRAFASLTEPEIDQIAEWLQDGKYDEVRERIAKPRPEGFGLTISNKPLETLWKNKNKVDKINGRISAGQKITLADFDAINSGERDDVTDEVHNAIMGATY